jgi:hypothetical protein
MSREMLVYISSTADGIRIECAEVVGSNNPTRSTSVNLVKYGIRLSLILTIVGQIRTTISKEEEDPL